MEPIKTELVVLGAGPGGYAAAFYAADKGKKVVLVEQEKILGGVCLNRGCIPSKALLHVTALLAEARESHKHGITFDPPRMISPKSAPGRTPFWPGYRRAWRRWRSGAA